MSEWPSKTEIVEDVRRIAADVLEISDDEDNWTVPISARLGTGTLDEIIRREALACDYLDRLEICVMVESYFDIAIPIEDMDRWLTLRDVAASVEKALGR